MSVHSVKIKRDACEGCVNCIRTCPTEGIRIVDGEVNILSELCIDCGECMRACNRKALGIEEDDWIKIKESQDSVYITDPAFFTQFSHYSDPSVLEAMMASNNLEVLIDDLEDAFDLSAYATAQLIARTPKASRPLISVYCPAVFRLIQSRFPELLTRMLPIFTPLELAADLWRLRSNSKKHLTLLAPCPAKITSTHEPIGRESSPFDHAVTVRKVARSLMAEGEHAYEQGGEPQERSNRWVAWARRGGESRHVQAFSDKKLTILAVSGMRNTLDALQELELGRMRGVDFIECRVCDTGCVGGIGTADSRFLSSLRLSNIEPEWNISEEDMTRTEELYAMDFWAVTKDYLPKQGLPLSDNVADAMLKLQQMKEIYNGLPHIDCGSCGRPSCQAMAEEIVRGHGSVTDCIFKLREGISTLADKIVKLSESQPQTLKKRSDRQ